MQRIWKVEMAFGEAMNIVNIWGDAAKLLHTEYSMEKFAESN